VAQIAEAKAELAARQKRISELEQQAAAQNVAKAAADQRIKQLEAGQRADNLAAIKQQNNLNAVQSSLTATQAELKTVATERKTLHKQVVQDVDLKRGLESELKAEKTRAILLAEQLKHERNARLAAEKAKCDPGEITAAVKKAFAESSVGQFLACLSGLFGFAGGAAGVGGTAVGGGALVWFRKILIDKLKAEAEDRKDRVNGLKESQQTVINEVKSALARGEAEQQKAATEFKQTVVKSVDEAQGKIESANAGRHEKALEHIKAVGAKVTEGKVDLAKAIDDQKGEQQKAADDLKQSQKDATQAVKDAVDAARDDVNKASACHHRETLDQIKAVGDKVSGGNAAVAKALDDQKAEHQRTAAELKQSVEKAVEEARGKLDSASGCRHEKSQALIKAVGKKVMKGNADLAKALDDQKGEQQRTSAELKQSVEKAVEEARGKLESANGCRHEKTLEQIKSGDAAIKEAIEGQKAEQEKAASNLGDAIVNAKQDVEKSVSDSSSKLETGNANRHRETTEQIKEVGEAVKSGDAAIKQAIEGQKAEQEKAASDLGDAIVNAKQDVEKSVSDSSSKLESDNAERHRETASQIEAVGKAVTENNEALGQAIAEQAAEQMNAISDLDASIEEVKDVIKDSVGDAAEELEKANAGRHQETTEQIEACCETATANSEALKQAVEGQTAAQEKTADELNASIEEVKDVIKDSVGDAAEELEKANAGRHQETTDQISGVDEAAAGRHDELKGLWGKGHSTSKENASPRPDPQGRFETELINGIGRGLAEELDKQGVSSLKELSEAQANDLEVIRGISAKKARDFIEKAGWIVALAEVTGNSVDDVAKALYAANFWDEIERSEYKVSSPEHVEAVRNTLQI
jgi:hypothetical protein